MNKYFIYYHYYAGGEFCEGNLEIVWETKIRGTDDIKEISKLIETQRFVQNVIIVNWKLFE